MPQDQGRGVRFRGGGPGAVGIVRALVRQADGAAVLSKDQQPVPGLDHRVGAGVEAHVPGSIEPHGNSPVQPDRQVSEGEPLGLRKGNGVPFRAVEIEQLPESLAEAHLRAGMGDHLRQGVMLPQGGDAVLLRQGGGENELAAGEKGEDAEIRLPAAPLQGGNGQQGLDGAGVVRGMDDHRFAAREGAALQGGGVRDVRAAADDAEIFGTFHIFRDILLHLFPLHIVRHDDAGILARGGQHQLPQEGVFAGIEAQDHGMPAFQNL